MRSFHCLCFVTLFSAAASIPALDLPDPTRTLYVHLSTDSQGRLLYSLSARGQTRLLPAPLGIKVDGADLGLGVNLGPVQQARHYEVYPWLGGKNWATNDCWAFEIPARTASGTAWTLEVRVFPDGAAFRYHVPGTGRRLVQGESTAFQLPPHSILWFQTNLANHEGIYESCHATNLPTVTGPNAVPLRMGLPVTVLYPDGSIALLSEARLLHYSGLALQAAGPARLEACFPHDPQGWDCQGPILSPWRVAIVVENLDQLVNSDIIPSLCDPPDPELFPHGAHTDWIRPGRAPCTWMVFGNDGARWDRQKWFVDTAAALGCEYLLVDAGWQTERWGWMQPGTDLWTRVAELCTYAAQRNVGILLWHAYPDGRDDGPGLTTTEARETFFRNCQKAGVKGVKIDFFDSESVETVAVCEDLRRRAAQHRLLINFHGIPKPTGENRTWPHELTREGIREQEYLLWGRLPLHHYGALPFTRLVVGPADFLPGFVQRRMLKETTAAFQLASTVVFSSPLLCWPDHPEAYLHSPALSFFRRLPVHWDETRVLPESRVGELVLLARRKDREWYVAALNCRPQPTRLTLTPDPFAPPGQELTLYRDNPDLTGLEILSRHLPTPPAPLQFELAPGGGAVFHFHPPNKWRTWF